MEPKEKSIEKGLISSMRSIGIFCEGQQSGVAYRRKGGKTYPIHMQREGTPDIIACVPTVITPEMVGKSIGVFYGIEVKRNEKEKKKWEKYDHTTLFKKEGYHRRTEMQKVRKDEILASGGKFILACSFDDLSEVLQDRL